MTTSTEKIYTKTDDEIEKAAIASVSAELPEHPVAIKNTLMGQLIGSPLNFLCPGCGYGGIAMAISEILGEMEAERMRKYPIVIGIGCYTTLPTILPMRQTVCTLHGRALPVATGIKLANPEFKPLVLTGDGDCLAIGAGHFVNACRRNIDAVIIMLSNNVYGMTGGQLAPTSYTNQISTTSPYGFAERPFDAVKLAMAAGASYVSRWTSIHIHEFIRTLKKSINHKGLSFIEVVSTCPTKFGGKNGFREPVDLMKHIRDNSININIATKMSTKELQNKIIIGEFKKEISSELSESYLNLKKKRGCENEN